MFHFMQWVSWEPFVEESVGPLMVAIRLGAADGDDVLLQ